MRITLVTVGTRGDVQPYIALGLGLQAAGHTVTLATHATFEAEIRRRGLQFAAVEGNPQAIMQGSQGQAWQKTADNPFEFNRQLRKIANPLLECMMADCLQACTGSELIVYTALGWLATGSVVEKLGVPGFPAYLQHATPTSTYPYPSFPTRRLGAWYNRLTYQIAYWLVWQMFREPINRARGKVLGLPPIEGNPFVRAIRAGRPLVYGFSPSVLPKPKDWGEHVHVTGFWLLDAPADWQPPVALVNFLQAGPPPVYVSFGSTGDRKPEETTTLVVIALQLAVLRGVLGSSWGGIGQGDLPPSVVVADYVPHDRLFPQMAAVVHHGGAGTTAAGLRAGIPSVIVPFFADQPFWAQRVYELGAGPKPIPQARLSAENLAEALQFATSDRNVLSQSKKRGAQIRAENGIACAVEVIERFVKSDGH